MDRTVSLSVVDGRSYRSVNDLAIELLFFVWNFHDEYDYPIKISHLLWTQECFFKDLLISYFNYEGMELKQGC